MSVETEGDGRGQRERKVQGLEGFSMSKQRMRWTRRDIDILAQKIKDLPQMHPPETRKFPKPTPESSDLEPIE